jgi:DNA polymerase-3 subunit beta
MKFEGLAGTLAAALAMAELALDDKSNVAALAMVRIGARDGGCEFVVDALDRRIAVNVPVTVTAAGEASARCASLSGVLARLPAGKQVQLGSDGDDVVVSAGRSRFRIRGLPFDRLPQSAVLETATAEFSLAREEVLRLIRSGFAAADGETRQNLNGVFFHCVDTTLCAVATDGARLALANVPLPVGSENMPNVIIPNKALDIITKLLKRKDAPENVTLRISDRLFEILLPDLLKLTSN